jgi:uncharacterized repeat protein (TIGR01451 family)
MEKWIFTILLFLISKSQILYAQCTITADAGPDIHTCNANIYINLYGNGQSSSGYLGFQWRSSYQGYFSSGSSQNATYMLSAIEIAAGGTYIILKVTDPVMGCMTSDTLRIIYDSCPNYGLVTGIVFNDLDSNGVQDPGENGIPNKIVGTAQGATFTNASGYYQLSVPNGSSQIFTSFAGWTASTPSSYTATIASDTLTNYNFGMYLRPNITEVSIDLFATVQSPGFRSTYFIYYQNNGSSTSSGTIEFKYDSNLSFNSSSPTENVHDILTKTLTYNYTNLLPGERRIIHPSFHLSSVTPLGITLKSWISITPSISDVYFFNNYDTLTLMSVGSFDPNDKQVKPVGLHEEHYIKSTDELQYVIHFQNTGTAPAHNIIVVDTLANTLDINSIKIVAASHSYRVEKDNRIVKWIFENIMLPDSNSNEPQSHGFISFKISQNPVNTDGTQIKNSAAIYFDYNSPVITNSTLNTVGNNLLSTGLLDEKKSNDEDFYIYPNPNSDYLYINGKFKMLDYQIISTNGITLAEGNYLDGINTSILHKGIYILKTTTETGFQYKKLVIN